MAATTQTHEQGFTLLELLIVLGIISILSFVLITTLSPTEVLKEARDAQRLSDLSTLKKALGIYQVLQVSQPAGSANTVYVSVADVSPTCANLALPPLSAGWSYRCVSSDNLKSVDGTGWVPINFTLITGGSPISSLPVDPLNTIADNNYYTFVAKETGWLTVAHHLESLKNATLASSDGGTLDLEYEVGTAMTLSPFMCGNSRLPYQGQSYRTTQIGSQCWLRDNLNVGTPIASFQADNTTVQQQADNDAIEKYCYGYTTQNDGAQLTMGVTNCTLFGGLYQYEEAVGHPDEDPADDALVQGICPVGWHIPRDSDWELAEIVAGVSPGAVMKASEAHAPAWNGLDLIGFSLVPAGTRDAVGLFGGLHSLNLLWTSRPLDDTHAYARVFQSDSTEDAHAGYDRTQGFSVRCVKN